jgi:catechol 2,3-dioxygenase-like lactoylglutathione lyase family enzyme
MRPLLLAFFAIVVSANQAVAQLAAPNASGVSIGHLHFMVGDPEEHKKMWVGVLGAEVVHAGALEMLKLPGIFIVIGNARTPPTEGSEGSTVNHVGLAVQNLEEIKKKLAAANVGFATDNPRIAIFPDKVRVELAEETTLKVPVAFHHIHLASPDQEKLRAWYVKTFGATAGTRGTFLAAFIPGGEVDFRKSDVAQAPTKGRSLDHIGFEVKGLEAFCQKLAADGITFEMAYRDVPQIGLKIAFLVDPEGTRIELTEGMAGR